jgi:exodeoxyribonuclease III
VRIVTWNINSVRLRQDLALKVVGMLKADILCLQETKCPDTDFPFDAFRKAGYPHIHIHGMKGYNGVAIMSRTAFTRTHIFDRAGMQDCRHIAVDIQGPDKKNISLHNLYVPAGGDIPDVTVNDKFAHKLRYVEDAAQFFKKTYVSDDRIVAVGDFNIAPLEHDVWSHKQLLDVVSHTPQEVDALNTWQKSLGFVDAVRHFVPQDQKCYTWWSYRNRDWKKSNRGRRLDHIWVTPPLKPALKAYHISQEVRDWPQTSDHVPVMLELF